MHVCPPPSLLSTGRLGPLVVKGAIYASVDLLVCVSVRSVSLRSSVSYGETHTCSTESETRRCAVGPIFTKKVNESCVSSLFTFHFVCSVKRIKFVWDRTLPWEYQPGTMWVLESKVTIQSA